MDLNFFGTLGNINYFGTQNFSGSRFFLGINIFFEGPKIFMETFETKNFFGTKHFPRILQDNYLFLHMLSNSNPTWNPTRTNLNKLERVRVDFVFQRHNKKNKKNKKNLT